ncbi:hypothetical protein [Aeribacillus pallidus]|jgi:dihydroorotase-like cyclic amidohydrolase|uniref:hypothetical protein n=1 Tax=Aeribacillus pallidus TaxID=33936 RepID=UPI001DA793EB|nr:hypothetical protein [Bacillus sp. (in: firmicutes)]
MSQNKKEKVIHVDKLTIHAKEVEFIHDRMREDFPKRDPWDFFWRRPRKDELNSTDTDVQEAREGQN